VNQNFEALKAQMQAKRKLAENKFEKDKSVVEPSIESDEDEEYITLNIIDDEEEEDVQVTPVREEVVLLEKNEIPPIKEEVIEQPVTIITPVSKKAESAPDISMNRIVLKKVEKQEAPKRITYYLKPETIKKIDKFSKAAGMGKSEFVQTILDEILNNLEIEK
jgi:hypothetical protein